MSCYKLQSADILEILQRFCFPRYDDSRSYIGVCSRECSFQLGNNELTLEPGWFLTHRCIADARSDLRESRQAGGFVLKAGLGLDVHTGGIGNLFNRWGVLRFTRHEEQAGRLRPAVGTTPRDR